MQRINDIDDLINLFSVMNFSTEEQKLSQIFIDVAKFYDIHHRHQYHLISQYVFLQREKAPDSISYILNNIQYMINVSRLINDKLKDALKEENLKLSFDEILIKIEKLYDHIALEEARLINNQKDINESGKVLRVTLMNQFNGMSRDLAKQTDNISTTLNANTMTVIGLFSAIIFVFFGGITGLSSVIKGIFELTERKDLTIPFIIICFIGWFLFDIVFMLLYCVSKILNRNIGCKLPYCVKNHFRYEENNGCFAIYDDDYNKKKCVIDKYRAEKICRRKNRNATIIYCFKKILRSVVLRFPGVFLFNVVCICLIVFFYLHIN